MSKLPDVDNPPKSDSWLGYAPLIAGGIAIVLMIAYAFVFSALSWTDNPASWGAFGDYVGGLLNPTIALFTLMVAVQVWRLQKKELKETKDTLRKQLDVDVFFRQIQIHQSLVENLVYENVKGRDSLRLVCKAIWERSTEDEIKSLVWEELDGSHDWTSTNDLPVAEGTPIPEHLKYVHAFTHAYENGKTVGVADRLPLEFLLAHCFRSVYAVLRNIQESENLKESDQITLVQVLRSQIGEEEFVLLAANGATQRGRKFRARALRSDLFRSRLTLHSIGKTFVSCYEPNQDNLKWADKVLAED
jgi:hypothetical protein